MKNRIERRRPSSYAGSCISCLTGTDTGLAFQGSADWCVAGLTRLGLPFEDAVATFRAGVPLPPPRVTVTYRVCRSCTRKADMPDPKLIIANGEIPCFREPSEVT